MIFLLLVLVLACSNNSDPVPDSEVDVVTEEDIVETEEISESASEVNNEIVENTEIMLETTKGNIKIRLLDNKMPITTSNFKNLVEEGFYEGVIFHRVVPEFIVQTGGFASGMNKKEEKPFIKNEAKEEISNEQYTVAMGRKIHPDTASTQFYINLNNNGIFLDENAQYGRSEYGYAVFGKVIEGTEVVDAIGTVETNSILLSDKKYEDVPIEEIVIKKAYVI